MRQRQTSAMLMAPLLLVATLLAAHVQGFVSPGAFFRPISSATANRRSAPSCATATNEASPNGEEVNGSSSLAIETTSESSSPPPPSTTTATTSDTAIQEQRHLWKEKIQALAFRTMRGFQASPTDRQRMTFLLKQIAQLNPTLQPAAAYYDDLPVSNESSDKTEPSLAGRWTLLYTDAPDILTLADNDRIARVQRIGQECDAVNKTITNVIEWIPPVWAGALPLAQPTRVLQKVVTKASASPNQPNKVNLLLQGLEVDFESFDNSDTDNPASATDATALTKPWWPSQPLRLQGPLTAPFGSFELLYLDHEIRIIRTVQGYYAVNKRNTPDTEWF